MVTNFSWVAVWAPRVFLLMGAGLGLFYALGIPPLQVPDEESHFIRAYGISQGRCIPLRFTPVPHGIPELQERFPPLVEQRREQGFSAEELWQRIHGAMQDTPDTTATAFSSNLYSCVPYLPAAAAIRVGRFFEVSAALSMYLGRLANLAAFLTLTWLALRLLPDLHALLLAIACMPMTLHQAASLSADSMMLAFAFLFTAFVLRLREGRGRIGLGVYFILGVLILLVALTKFNPWLTLLIALIPPERLGGRRNWWIALAGFILLAAAATVTWQWADREATQVYAEAITTLGTDVDANRRLLLANPLATLRSVTHSILNWPWMLGLSFVGIFGYLSVPLPAAVGTFYLGFLIVVAATQTQRTSFTVRDRLFLAAITLASVATVFVVLSMIWTPTADLRRQLSEGGVMGSSQGRYYIPFALPALLILANTKLRLAGRTSLLAVAGCCVATNLVAFWTILAGFYR